MEVLEINFSDMWKKEGFMDWAISQSPSSIITQTMEKYQNSIEIERQKVEKHFRLVQKKFDESMINSRDEFYSALGQRMILLFKDKFQLSLKQKDSKILKNDCIGYLDKINEVKMVPQLNDQILAMETEISVQYYLIKGEDKNVLMNQMINQGKNLNRFSSKLKLDYFSLGNEMILKNYSENGRDILDYIQFLDYYSLVDPKKIKDKNLSTTIDFVFIDDKLLNFDVYDFLFKYYNQEQNETFLILYKIINQYRAQYGDPSKFEEFLIRYEYLPNEASLMLSINLIFYFTSSKKVNSINLDHIPKKHRYTDIIKKLMLAFQK